MPIVPSSSGLTFNGPVSFNATVCYDGTVLSRRVPLVPEPAHTSSLGDRALAAQIGVETTVITAYREGQPFWKLERDAKKVALGVGIDVRILRAAIDRAKLRKVLDRRFPSMTRAGYASIRSSRR